MSYNDNEFRKKCLNMDNPYFKKNSSKIVIDVIKKIKIDKNFISKKFIDR